MKFESEIPKQTWVTFRKACHLQSPDIAKSNMKVTLLKNNRLLPIATSDVALKFGLDIQSRTKVRIRKPKNPRWQPGGHFESDIAENQQASAHGHQQHVYKISNWNSKANLSFAPEIMSPTDGRTDRQTDRQTDRETRWFQYTPPLPTNFVRRVYNTNIYFISTAYSDTWFHTDTKGKCWGFLRIYLPQFVCYLRYTSWSHLI